jgi:hypothetical protein
MTTKLLEIVTFATESDPAALRSPHEHCQSGSGLPTTFGICSHIWKNLFITVIRLIGLAGTAVFCGVEFWAGERPIY